MRVAHLIGTRPNVVKCAPVMRALEEHQQLLVRVMQHNSRSMFEDIADDVGLKQPDVTVEGFAETVDYLLATEPDVAMVYGDCRCTRTGAIAAKAAKIPVAHVEAGLRSFDDSMEEEGIRREVDSVSDLLFTHSAEANENLRIEGVQGSIRYVGNVLADSLALYRELKPPRSADALLTLHRPFNVDGQLSSILSVLGKMTRQEFIWPVHPRCGQVRLPANVRATPPQRYRAFINFLSRSAFVLTDSGGVQEESSILGIPCLTLRPNTERLITLTRGTNKLTSLATLENDIESVLTREWKPSEIPLWDGHAAERIAEILEENFC